MYSREGRINHRLTALDVFLAAMAGNVEQKMLMVCTLSREYAAVLP